MTHLVDMVMGAELLAEHTAATLPEALRVAAEWAEIAERDGAGGPLALSSYRDPQLVLDLVAPRVTTPPRPGSFTRTARVHVRVWEQR